MFVFIQVLDLNNSRTHTPTHTLSIYVAIYIHTYTPTCTACSIYVLHGAAGGRALPRHFAHFSAFSTSAGGGREAPSILNPSPQLLSPSTDPSTQTEGKNLHFTKYALERNKTKKQNKRRRQQKIKEVTDTAPFVQSIQHPLATSSDKGNGPKNGRAEGHGQAECGSPIGLKGGSLPSPISPLGPMCFQLLCSPQTRKR